MNVFWVVTPDSLVETSRFGDSPLIYCEDKGCTFFRNAGRFGPTTERHIHEDQPHATVCSQRDIQRVKYPCFDATGNKFIRGLLRTLKYSTYNVCLHGSFNVH